MYNCKFYVTSFSLLADVVLTVCGSSNGTNSLVAGLASISFEPVTDSDNFGTPLMTHTVTPHGTI